MSKVILHIGTAKTATTTIQKLLYEKRKDLAESGIYCPLAGRPHPQMGGHHFLPWSLLYPDRYDKSVWQNLLGELKQVPSDQDVQIVLSSEEFSQLSLDEIIFVRKQLESYDVTVVVYLRNQKDFMMSLYKQFIKTGHYHDEFHNFIIDLFERCEYAEWLERWHTIFGDENLQVRLYDQAKKTSGLIHDFFCVALSKNSDGIAFENWGFTKEGVSPSDDAIKILRFINKVEQKLPYRYVIAGTSLVRRKMIWRTKIGRLFEKVGGQFFSEELYTARDIESLKEKLETTNQKLFARYIAPRDQTYFDF